MGELAVDFAGIADFGGKSSRETEAKGCIVKSGTERKNARIANATALIGPQGC